MVYYAPSGAWAAFEKAQRASDSRFVNSATWAYDEAMDDVLSEMLDGTLSSENMETRIRSLLLNRLRKHRRRHQLYRDLYMARQGEAIGNDSQVQLAENEGLLGRVQGELSPVEWHLLLQLASGTSYKELAAGAGVPEGRIRTQAARTRERVRRILGNQPQDTN